VEAWTRVVLIGVATFGIGVTIGGALILFAATGLPGSPPQRAMDTVNHCLMRARGVETGPCPIGRAQK
jgi:hypothetical protein